MQIDSQLKNFVQKVYLRLLLEIIPEARERIRMGQRKGWGFVTVVLEFSINSI